MGLYVVNFSFINFNNFLWKVLVEESVKRLVSGKVLFLVKFIDEKSIFNVFIGLMVIGGFINYILYLIVIVRFCGVIFNWDDFDVVFNFIFFLVKVYFNGLVDVNVFEVCGGLVFVIKELLKEGFLFEDVYMIMDIEM